MMMGNFLPSAQRACSVHDRSVPSKLRFLRILDTSSASAEGEDLILIVSVSWTGPSLPNVGLPSANSL